MAAVLLMAGMMVWAGSDPLLVTCGDRAPPWGSLGGVSAFGCLIHKKPDRKA